jgi:hypothetical protein
MMRTKRLRAVVKPLTADGAVGYVRVADQSGLRIGAEVSLSSTAPLSATRLQIVSLKGVPGSTDVLVYLNDAVTGLTFDASLYLVADAADLSLAEQTLWGFVDLDSVPFVYSDPQWREILAEVLPAGGPGGDVPEGVATEGTLLTRLSETVFTARTPTLGQKAMAGSSPVVIASDQSSVRVEDAPVMNKTTTYNYNGSGDIESIVTVRADGKTITDTFNYVGGNLQSITRVVT